MDTNPRADAIQIMTTDTNPSPAASEPALVDAEALILARCLRYILQIGEHPLKSGGEAEGSNTVSRVEDGIKGNQFLGGPESPQCAANSSTVTKEVKPKSDSVESQ